MGALPRPDLAPGPARDLNDALHDLHHRAGWPSLRTMASDAGCSHTTVSHALSGPRLPAWGIVEVLVDAMGGDVPAFHDLWLAASAPRPGEEPPPRIAGRAAELGAVRRHLEAGEGLLLVTGEAGMGKTRLVTTARGTTDVFVATGACLPLSSDVPLLPIADALRVVYESDGGQWLKEALTDTAPYVTPSLSRLLPELHTVKDLGTGIEDEWSRQRLFAAICTTLTRLGALRPVALLIEDLHWADLATLDLVEHLVARTPRLSLTGTWRTDDPATPAESLDWSTRVRRAANVGTLQLEPLSRDETAAQLALLTMDTPSPELVDRIHNRSQGQPLYTEQLAAHADDELTFPALLGDLLDRRLDGLEADSWSVARILGVADRQLTDEQLREVAGLGSGPLADGLRQLTGRRLLTSPGPSVGLRHPLLAEAVRRRCVLVESVDVHRRLATAMADWEGASAAEVAAHWEAAHEPDQELQWRIRAALAAQDRFAATQAADQWLRVITLWGEHGSSRQGVSLCDAYCAAVDALDDSGHGQQAAAVMEEAALRLHPIEGLDRARMLTRLGKTRGYTNTEAAMPVLEEALAVYEDLPPSVDHVDLLVEVAGHLYHRGRGREATRMLARAAEVSALGGFVDRYRMTLMDQAWAEVMYGDVDVGWGHVEAAARLERTRADPSGDVRAGVLLTDMMLKTGAPAESVVVAAAEGLRAAQEWLPETFRAATLQANAAEALLREGQVSRAAQFVVPLTEAPLTHDRFRLYLVRAHIEMLSGNLATATAIFDELGSLSLSSLLIRSEVALVSSEHLLWLGDAELTLDRLTDILQHSLPTELAAFQGVLLSRAARAAGDRGREKVAAREHLLALLASARTDPFMQGRVPADGHAHGLTWTAELARLDGIQTVEHWVPAAAEWDRLTRPHEAAYCRWRAAQAALRDGQGTVAARLLKRAASDAREHVPLAREVRRLAGQ